jgi:hypothetical protein
VKYEIRPISDRTAFKGDHRGSQFQSPWWATEELLCFEVEKLDGEDLVIEVDVEEYDIRVTGQLKANARASTPAVRVAFNSMHGPLVYATDVFAKWQDNVRAIALGLEALRKVDRYGISRRGEQYAGYLQIEAGPGIAVASHMTRHAAAELLERLAIGEEGESRDRAVQRILTDQAEARAVLRHARSATHPDRHGDDRTLWDQVEQAAQVLGIAS